MLLPLVQNINEENQFMLLLLYVPSLISLIISINCFVLCFVNKTPLCINRILEVSLVVPPLMGVIGTVFSFYSLVSAENSLLFKSFFLLAADTTIFGAIL
jgi:hypothetical protein